MTRSTSDGLLALGGSRFDYVLTSAPLGAPTLVFLHEGLGSVSMWREFPAQLAARAGCGALVYSRLGHGNSDPEPGARPTDFLLTHGRDTLPALLARLGLDDVVLVGHSDGGTIALTYLAAGHRARGAIVVAPHVLDEPVTWRAIAEQRASWGDGKLRIRLARHHRDPAAAFEGWAGQWLSPAFRNWTIVALLPAIRVPLLAVQGAADIYGTMRQIDEIARHAGGPVELATLEASGHDPFRDAPERMLELCAGFVAGLDQPCLR
jgi:pimeloyl-ACP methyl ester carboxylesterase